jgi:hypothetical protein
MRPNSTPAAADPRRPEFFGPVRPLDLLLLAGLLIFSASLAWPSLGNRGASSEDGAMLLRYSQNVAEGHGIVWNVGQSPVEGATDFLYMLAVAGVASLTHENALIACRELLFFSWIALTGVVFACTRWTLRAPTLLAFGVALYICGAGEGPYLQTFFGAPFLMLLVAITWWIGVALIAGRLRPTLSVSLAFSVLALTVGLTRPEANVLSFLLLGTIVFLLGFHATRRLILTFAAIFLLLGGAYFAWRWHYFGYLLPNPFYVKGGGHLHLQGLERGISNVIRILWPAFPIAALALRNAKRRRLLLGLIIPIAGYTAIWILLSPENNHLMRFQMPVLPVTLLFLPLLLENLFGELGLPWPQLSSSAQRSLALAGCFYAVSCFLVFRGISPGMVRTSGQDFATYLSRFQDRGYTMAVTEAGQFPYFSRWNAIDALGLNDAYIAHHGLDEAYLDRSQPELILYHLYVPPPGDGSMMHADEQAITLRDVRAVRVLYQYAQRHHYILAAAYGAEPCNLNVFYVRPNTPDTQAIVNYLRDTPYYFLDNGKISTDYRDGFKPFCKFADLSAPPDAPIAAP